MSDATVFCTLHIRSNVLGALPKELFRTRKKMNLVFIDQASTEVQERRGRVRRQLGLPEAAIPRYHWRLSSEGFVTNDEVHDHLEWIFGCMQPGKLLGQVLGSDFEYWFSIFWQGNGTGGGPLITVQTAELIVRHNANLGIAFYVDSSD